MVGVQFLKRFDESKAKELMDEVRGRVEDILNQIRLEGWDALARICESLDGFAPSKIKPDEIQEAWQKLSTEMKEALKVAEKNIRSFHRAQREILKDFTCDIDEGIKAGMRFIPVKSAAVYVPGGRYPLPSTVLMGVIPAQEAGVERIAVLTPPGRDGRPNSVTLAAMGMLGIREAWAIGGAQAIAAVAFGAGDIKQADIVVGPGNAYVTEAKRQVFGIVGIDGLAGPSEVMIVADSNADPKFLAADMVAQLEHDPSARAMLLTTDESIAKRAIGEVYKLLDNIRTSSVASVAWENGGAVAVGTLEEISRMANEVAPEHLELAVEKPESVLELFTCYGAAFLGNYSPVPFGDYIAGTNHILPTGRSAKFQGGLWVGTFLRPLQHLYASKEAALNLARHGARIADAEGLAAHSLSMRMRGLY
ncbi:histidinol dehydrogenase [Acetomicrobium hydrogeniformans ATCC BAA-1850]|uniref:Histidinol dehydrogenase n=1 Tax=Acetomicrobium hydrogeniformans ATCC BAA-1850 TaxID=592015 RepID=A0A0T5X947_9BACT|nr:histidinol dehydrogenase [Acetomicrobium hydrogeniformans ATCC BAA-1850]